MQDHLLYDAEKHSHTIWRYPVFFGTRLKSPLVYCTSKRLYTRVIELEGYGALQEYQCSINLVKKKKKKVLI